MPELPEVETTLRGISPHLAQRRVAGVRVRQPRLRNRVPEDLSDRLVGHTVDGLARRGKYLLLAIGGGHLLIHLGMSGSLRIVPATEPPGKHDHVDIDFDSGKTLRFTDPRRFGVVDWIVGDPFCHPLLNALGPEPLDSEFCGSYLYQRSRGRKVPVKSLIMDSHVVVGVGNIYANESLFMAGIHPLRMSGRVGPGRYERLAECIRVVLSAAIEQGGTTLRDFVGGDGKPGYFSQSLDVYGRGGEPCVSCGRALREVRLAQRTTVFCLTCQR